MEEVGCLSTVWSTHWARLQERPISVHNLQGDAEILTPQIPAFLYNYTSERAQSQAPKGQVPWQQWSSEKCFSSKCFHSFCCQTTSFFVPKALACWSHLFLLDCKSPSSLETLCVHLFPCRAQHVLAHLNISMFSELAWDKNVMARAGLSLSLCQLGGFCFAQLRSAVFVQT